MTIAELAGMVKAAVGFAGGIVSDRSKPDGTPRKLMDVSQLTCLNGKPRTDLLAGLANVYRDFR